MAYKWHSHRIAFLAGYLILSLGAWLTGAPAAQAQFVCESEAGGADGASATGTNSMAFGTNATADGENATAVGGEAEATGLGSTAVGAFARYQRRWWELQQHGHR